ncbi:MAG TPA: site-specific integrase [Acidimicrobiales bacterium]|nr:site-specific integrase [Acidimicrobiales bacterium]
MAKSAFGTIRRLESGRYNARIRVRGRQITVGTFPTRRAATAAIAAAGAEAGGERVIDRAAGRQHLEVFAERWWTTRIGHRPSTRARDRLVLDHDLLPFLGRIPLAELAPADVQAWVAALGARLSPSSVRRAFTILDQLLDATVDAGVLMANPAARVRLPRVSHPEMGFLTPAELEVLADTIDSRYRAMVLTMAWATLRIGEAAGLRRADLGPDATTLRVANNVVEVGGRVHEGPPKTSAGQRTMRLPASVAAELSGHLDRHGGDPYVFPHADGGVLRAEEWRRRFWRPAVAAAGVAPLRPHDLKHSGVAFLAAAGVDPSEIARRAGHASVAFTYDRYGHLLPEVDKQAAAKLEHLRSASA